MSDPKNLVKQSHRLICQASAAALLGAALLFSGTALAAQGAPGSDFSSSNLSEAAAVSSTSSASSAPVRVAGLPSGAAASTPNAFEGAPAERCITEDDRRLPHYHCDVLVIGAGAAGLTAAIEASRAGADVIVLEKMPMAGGNTILSLDGLLALSPERRSEVSVDVPSAQVAAPSGAAVAHGRVRHDVAQGLASPNVAISALPPQGEALFASLSVHHAMGEPVLSRKLIAESSSALAWLESCGIDLSSKTAHPGFAGLYSRRPANGAPLGFEVIRGLLQATEAARIPVQTLTRAEAILYDERTGAVSGVRAHGRCGALLYEAGAVVIATGGYAASIEVIRSENPTLPLLSTTNSAGATGDGLVLARKAGGVKTKIGCVSMHCTTLAVTGSVVPQAVRVDGAILVNDKGRRFVNELLPSDEVAQAILSEPNNEAWLVFDESILEKDRTLSAAADIGSLDVVYRAPNPGVLARQIGVSPKQFTETVFAYRRMAQVGKDTAFGRQTLNSSLEHGDLCAVRVRPAYHSTSAGVAINTSAQVLRASGRPIPGLFAAGEVAGGVFGRHVPDNLGIVSAVVFGRTAGARAAAFASERAAEKRPADAALVHQASTGTAPESAEQLN